MNSAECKCDLRTRLVGDGCEVCNPKLALEIVSDQMKEALADADEQAFKDLIGWDANGSPA